ncbi:hypothetical protein AVEN_63122-1 [Araneus ventricosus]|uniref:CCHC-type domain-containing protein n=1 Tax=Araneus ventricosus TaxID=182803 RepID=A0A4Y2T9E9_ARAVE|nr:hypothetical protein AVEN_63122-1 [Araneus ventricosus]
MDRIQKSDTLKDKITSRLPAKRHPSIIIYDIPNDTTDEEIQASLKANTGIEKDLKLRFKLRGRKQETSHWIMEAPAEEFHKIIPVEKISVNWEIHNIKEFYHIQRCNNCHEYGHPAAKCTATRPFCGYCAQRHPTSKCRTWYPRCINCEHSNATKGTRYRTDHPASSPNCSSYKKEIQTYKNTRDY